MNSFIQADVFFFITTVAIVLLVVLFAVLLVYLIKIMKDAREVTKKLSEETSAQDPGERYSFAPDIFV